MLFNSTVFLQFLAAFLLAYFAVRNRRGLRNLLIIGASYLFYGWWDVRFLGLLVFSSILDFGIGLGLQKNRSPRMRRFLLALSVGGNLGVLGFFKYFDFFSESLVDLLAVMGIGATFPGLQVVLPVGISFYTFQTMSYTIDVYRGRIQPTRSLVEFLAYVSFFPQLVAGPIERAERLLPQFARTLVITGARIEEGLWLCVWGLFKKVVLADNLAPLVEMVYSGDTPSGPMVCLGTVAFAFQIYCDFSGYSDIARGVARLLGFDLMINFNIPYGALNIREFWRRWHISLSTWLRDYLYVSLGGNRKGAWRMALNLMVTMVLGGLWHGAAWNFVLWGVWHGLGLVIYRFWSDSRASADSSSFRFVRGLASWGMTMSFVGYGWLMFRSESLGQVMALTRALVDFSVPEWLGSFCVNLAVFSVPLVFMQLWQSRTGNLLAPMAIARWCRSLLMAGLLVAILFSWEKEQVPFLYFQF